MAPVSKLTYKRRAWTRKMRAFLGLCRDCGDYAPVYSECQVCHDKHVQCKAKRRNSNRSAGLCACGADTIPGGSKCQRCYERKRKWNRLQTHGTTSVSCLTSGCNNIPAYKKRYCDECLAVAEAERQSCNVYFIRCEDCGILLTAKTRGKKLCSDCAKLRQSKQNLEHIREKNGVVLLHKTCANCNKPFTTYNSRQKSCSTECGKRIRKRNENHLRRATRYGSLHIERVYMPILFKRDSCRCQICGKKLNLKRVVPHPMAATIDHIIPLSKGGEHSYRNTQLACFICNSTKSNNAGNNGDQLRLF